MANAIKSTNAAESSERERHYALAAVSVVSGVSQPQLSKQQNQMRLSLGEMLAFNTIASNRESKVRKLVNLRSQGKSWTDIAQTNGANITTVAKIVRRASDLTVQSCLQGSQEGADAANQLHDFGMGPQGTRQASRVPGP